MLIRVDHKLRIALSEIPDEETLLLITEALSIPNMERQKAMEQDIYGWRDMPEFIELWELDPMSKHLVMPRGFMADLHQGFWDLELDYKIVDERYDENTAIEMGNRITLMPWQMPAVEKILTVQQGIWKAPAGSGKTVGVLEAIRRAKTPSLVLVNTKDILYQWENRAKSFLGEDYPVSLIGDGKIQISDYLTIATVQTIHSRFDKLEEIGFFDNVFGFVCLDECHHATAETFNRIVNRFSALIRIGVSATPDKTGDFELAKKVLGPIFHETRHEDVDSIIKPHIFKIPTNFNFPYRGKSGRRPSNYPQLLQLLVTDPGRNQLIIKAIMMNPGSHSLVVSKRLEHFDILIQLLQEEGYPHNIFRLTGQESSSERQYVVKYATVNPCIIFSTLADEALDIPRLDSIFLIFPQRNTGLIQQQIGRVCRKHPAKDHAVVYDFADVLVGPLEAQWRVRRRDVYQPHRYEITIVNASQILEYAME